MWICSPGNLGQIGGRHDLEQIARKSFSSDFHSTLTGPIQNSKKN